MSSPSPEQLIGPAAAKALAEHFDLTPKAKPLAEVVTMEEAKDYGLSREFQDDFGWRGWSLYSESDKQVLRAALSSFVLRWLRARIDQNLSEPGQTYGRKSVWRLLTGREWE